MTSGPDCIAERSVWRDNGMKAAIRRLRLNKQVFHRWIKQWIWGFLLSLNLFRLSWVLSCVVIRHSQCYFRLLLYKVSNMSEQQQQLDVYSTWTFTVLLCLSCMNTQREYLAHVNSKTLFRLFQNLSKMIKLTERMSVPNLVKFCERWSSGQKEEIHILFFIFWSEKLGRVHGFLHD